MTSDDPAFDSAEQRSEVALGKHDTNSEPGFEHESGPAQGTGESLSNSQASTEQATYAAIDAAAGGRRYEYTDEEWHSCAEHVDELDGCER